MREYARYDSGASTYREILAESLLKCFDWWETRNDIVIKMDRTRKDWGREDCGIGIIDRFTSSEICEVTQIAPRNDLFVPGTDHFITQAKFYIKDMHTTSIDEKHLRKWIERRIKIPPKETKQRMIEDFKQQISNDMASLELMSQPILNDKKFDEIYDDLTTILSTASKKIFGTRKMAEVRINRIRTPQIIHKIYEIRQLGRIIAALNRGEEAISILTSDNPQWATLLMMEIRIQRQIMIQKSDASMADAARIVIRRKRKERFRLEREAAKEIREKQKTIETKRVLEGGSAKRLAGHIQIQVNPVAITMTKEGVPEGEMATTEEDLKDATKAYFHKLYEKKNAPGEKPDAPWMDTISATKLREKSASLKMSWPPNITTDEIRYLLRKGKSAPSPGPDGWEKWCVRLLPDETLNIITRLVQYILDNSYFSDNMKETIVVTIFKKGDPTSLSNHRGVMLSNVLMSLQMWADAADLLPPHQVATRIGVQGRDATSLLSMITCWAKRNNLCVYALKKDQEKGFDYLSLQCFYDALKFYGLPANLEQFDRASQHQVRCRIQTIHGPTDPIIINDINRQGDHRSPKRYTLATGMGQWWIWDEAMKMENDQLITIRTINATQNNTHLPTDLEKVTITEIDMMDDTFFIAQHPHLLISMHEKNEVFQFAYGARTAFDKEKTMGYIINKKDNQILPKTIDIRIVENTQKINGKWCYKWDMKTIDIEENPIFLKTTINDQESMFYEIKNTMESFQIPKSGGILSLSAVRRIINQLLMPRITQRLRLQSISVQHAEKLDIILATLINKYFGWQSRVKASILQLDIDDNGFEFPSITDINATIAIKGLHRDLNHPCETIRRIAEVTLMDWTCQWNECASPLLMTEDRTRKINGYNRGRVMRWKTSRKCIRGCVPSSWQTAAEYLYKMNLSLVESDQSYISKGQISDEHMLGKSGASKQAKDGTIRTPHVDRTTTNTTAIPQQMEMKDQKSNIFKLKTPAITQRRFSNWARIKLAERAGEIDPTRIDLKEDPTALQFFKDGGFIIKESEGTHFLIYSIEPDGSEWGYKLKFPADINKSDLEIVNFPAMKPNIQRPPRGKLNPTETKKTGNIRKYITSIGDPVEGKKCLGIDREDRRREWERTIENWAWGLGSGLEGSRGRKERRSRDGPRVFATDGSMYPSSVKPGQRRTVSAASVTEYGEITAIAVGNTCQVMHGELLGIIMALIQGRGTRGEEIEIFSDYMMAVRNLRDHTARRKLREEAMKETGLDRFHLSKITEEEGLDNGAGRSWYRCLHMIWDEMEHNGIVLRLEHVKAHETNLDPAIPQQILNDKADKAAKAARDPATSSPNHCQWPTFALDRFAVWDESLGYIETDLYRYIKSRLKEMRKDALYHSDYIVQLNTANYEKGVHSEYMYKRATSDYSIRTQALARGKALYTNRKAWIMFPQSNNPMCPNCPLSIENEHHIFVKCPAYESARQQATKDLIEKIEKMDIGDHTKRSLTIIAEAMFKDKTPWPEEQTLYFLGKVPSLEEAFDVSEDEISPDDNQLETNPRRESRNSIRKLLHARAIRAAGYIWSIRMRNRHKRWRDNPEGAGTNRTVDFLDEIREESEDEEEEGWISEASEAGGNGTEGRRRGRSRKRILEEMEKNVEGENQLNTNNRTLTEEAW